MEDLKESFDENENPQISDVADDSFMAHCFEKLTLTTPASKLGKPQFIYPETSPNNVNLFAMPDNESSQTTFTDSIEPEKSLENEECHGLLNANLSLTDKHLCENGNEALVTSNNRVLLFKTPDTKSSFAGATELALSQVEQSSSQIVDSETTFKSSPNEISTNASPQFQHCFTQAVDLNTPVIKTVSDTNVDISTPNENEHNVAHVDLKNPDNILHETVNNITPNGTPVKNENFEIKVKSPEVCEPTTQVTDSKPPVKIMLETGIPQVNESVILKLDSNSPFKNAIHEPVDHSSPRANERHVVEKVDLKTPVKDKSTEILMNASQISECSSPLESKATIENVYYETAVHNPVQIAENVFRKSDSNTPVENLIPEVMDISSSPPENNEQPAMKVSDVKSPVKKVSSETAFVPPVENPVPEVMDIFSSPLAHDEQPAIKFSDVKSPLKKVSSETASVNVPHAEESASVKVRHAEKSASVNVPHAEESAILKSETHTPVKSAILAIGDVAMKSLNISCEAVISVPTEAGECASVNLDMNTPGKCTQDLNVSLPQEQAEVRVDLNTPVKKISNTPAKNISNSPVENVSYGTAVNLTGECTTVKLDSNTSVKNAVQEINVGDLLSQEQPVVQIVQPEKVSPSMEECTIQNINVSIPVKDAINVSSSQGRELSTAELVDSKTQAENISNERAMEIIESPVKKLDLQSPVENSARSTTNTDAIDVSLEANELNRNINSQIGQCAVQLIDPKTPVKISCEIATTPSPPVKGQYANQLIDFNTPVKNVLHENPIDVSVLPKIIQSSVSEKETGLPVKNMPCEMAVENLSLQKKQLSENCSDISLGLDTNSHCEPEYLKECNRSSISQQMECTQEELKDDSNTLSKVEPEFNCHIAEETVKQSKILNVSNDCIKETNSSHGQQKFEEPQHEINNFSSINLKHEKSTEPKKEKFSSPVISGMLPVSPIVDDDKIFKVPFTPPSNVCDEEFVDAKEFFKDNNLQFLENIKTSPELESALPRSSLYVNFDPLHSKFKDASNKMSRLQILETMKEQSPRGVNDNVQVGSNVNLRESLTSQLMSFDSPQARQNTSVPVDSRVSLGFGEFQPPRLYTAEELQEQLQTQLLSIQEVYLKTQRELEEEMDRKTKEFQAEIAKQTKFSMAQHGVMEELVSVATEANNRNIEVKEKMEAIFSENKTLKEELKTTQEDLQSVETTFADFHKRYEQCKGMLKTYKENEEHLRAEVKEWQVKLSEQEQMYHMLQERTEQALAKANEEVASVKKSNNAQNAVLVAQLKKSELRVSSLENDLKQTRIENSKLSGICDDLMAKVSGN